MFLENFLVYAATACLTFECSFLRAPNTQPIKGAYISTATILGFRTIIINYNIMSPKTLFDLLNY